MISWLTKVILLSCLSCGDEETQELQLKKLIIYAPILSMHDDDILCMMAKVNDDEDGKAWVVAIDMRRAVVEALALLIFCRMEVLYLHTMYRSCVLPKYLNTTPGDNPFERMSAKRCVVQVLWTLDWLQELDQCLEIERSTYNTRRLLLQLSACIVSALQYRNSGKICFA
jgi:hypothetical protein